MFYLTVRLFLETSGVRDTLSSSMAERSKTPMWNPTTPELMVRIRAFFIIVDGRVLIANTFYLLVSAANNVLG